MNLCFLYHIGTIFRYIEVNIIFCLWHILFNMGKSCKDQKYYQNKHQLQKFVLYSLHTFTNIRKMLHQRKFERVSFLAFLLLSIIKLHAPDKQLLATTEYLKTADVWSAEFHKQIYLLSFLVLHDYKGMCSFINKPGVAGAVL